MTDSDNHHTRHILQAHGLDDFEALWSLQADWFEAPNMRRGGWSGVVRLELDNEGGREVVFIKRQENHISRSWCHPFTGVPTFYKEYKNFRRLLKHDIPTLEPVFFAMRKMRSVLVTRSLENYTPLETVDPRALSRHHRHRLLAAVAKVLRQLHDAHFQHNCLYPKHIFVRRDGEDWQVKLIDLEKLKWTPLRRQAMVRDLFTLHRHAGPLWTLRDRIHFLRAYRQEKRLSPRSRALVQIITHKAAKKVRHQQGRTA